MHRVLPRQLSNIALLHCRSVQRPDCVQHKVPASSSLLVARGHRACRNVPHSPPSTKQIMAGLEPLLQTTVVKYHFANSKTAWEIRERDVVMIACEYASKFKVGQIWQLIEINGQENVVLLSVWEFSSFDPTTSTSTPNTTTSATTPPYLHCRLKNFKSVIKPLISSNHLFIITKNDLLICINLINGETIYSYDINQKIADQLKKPYFLCFYSN